MIGPLDEAYITQQLKGKHAGTCLVPVCDAAPPESGDWIGAYFTLAVIPDSEEAVWTVVVNESLLGVSIIYIQAPHKIMGALIGKKGARAQALLDTLNAAGFAASKISLKDEDKDPAKSEEKNETV